MSIKTFLQPKNSQILIILMVTFSCYFNTLFNDYSFDDEFITQNKYVQQGIHGLYNIWTHPYYTINDQNLDYRPLSLSIISLQWAVFGKHAMTDHLFNILYYLLCIVLLFQLTIRVFKLDKIHPYLPFVIILLYSIHPSHTEVVASLKNRDEIISFIFILLAAFMFDLSFKKTTAFRTAAYVLLTFLCLYLSILTKVISLPFWACMFLWIIYRNGYKRYTLFSIYLAGTFLIFVLHSWLFRDFLFQRSINFYENPLVNSTLLTNHLGLAFHSLFFYIQFLLLPYPGRFYYGYNAIPFESFFNPVPLASFFIYVSLTVLLIFSITQKRHYSYFLFAFLFYAVLYSNLFKIYTGIVSERAMFQFSFFFIAFSVLFLHHHLLRDPASKFKPAIRILAVVFFLFFSFLTIRRNFDWKDTTTLMVHDMKDLTTSTIAAQLAGTNCLSKCLHTPKEDPVTARKWAELAVYYLTLSIQISPERDQPYFSLGDAYKYGIRDLDLAEKNYLTAMERNPQLKRLSRELASLYFTKGEYGKAISFYAQAAKEAPDDPELLFYRALNLYNSKNTAEFLTLNAGLQKRFPESQYPYLNYGTYYFNLNEPVHVVENFEKAIQYQCNNPKVIDYVVNYYRNTGNAQKAAYYQSLKDKIAAPQN